MKLPIFLISAFLFFGYVPKNSKVFLQDHQNTVIEHDQWDYNFDFDEVIYYRNDKLTESKVLKVTKKKNKNRKNELLFKFSSFDKISLSDTVELTSLRKIGYKKIDFPKSKYEVLRAYFASEHNPLPESADSDIFKDILVLRKNDQTTHLIKISFNSDNAKMTDSEGYQTIWLGNYEYLEKLLERED